MAKRIALILAVLVAIYLGFLTWQAVAFISVTNPISLMLGLSLIALVALGAGLVLREIKFGQDVQQMCARVDFSAAPAQNTRLTNDQIADWVEQLQQQISVEPNNFSLWYHLASGYEMSHERPAARQALRHALRLFELTK
jgi:cytochrome c-type biogenesis protein CcmH/NrfG